MEGLGSDVASSARTIDKGEIKKLITKKTTRNLLEIEKVEILNKFIK
jgi:hypothetical protein